MSIDVTKEHRQADGVAWVVMYVAAAAFLISAIWYALIANHVTVASAPLAPPGEPLDSALHRWYQWFATTLPQERFNTAIALLGMLSLVVVAATLRGRFGRSATLSRIGGYALALGGVMWTIGNTLQLGGHRAVGLMATHDNPIEAVNAIAFTVDTVTQAFELVALLLIGGGMLALAAQARRTTAMRPGWIGSTATVAVAVLVLAAAYADASDDLTLWLLVGIGAVLLPVWLMWTARELAVGDVTPTGRTLRVRWRLARHLAR
ncbi:MAG TPA: hypothetical protein VFR11_14070 [Micromonosporaceae bacterium]|jgi:hypothetical protein|nr:hypothetical protein [Micromonosporaceae bacterium]